MPSMSSTSRASVVSLLHDLKAGKTPPAHIDFSCFNLKQPMLSMLCQLLSHDQHVRVLLLKGNGIGDSGSHLIASLLKRNTTLLRLDLSRNLISPAGISTIARAMLSNSTLLSLDLSYNAAEMGVLELAELLADPRCHLQCLKLRHNAIEERVLVQLARSMLNNSSLLYLDVSRNEAHETAAKAFSKVLKHNNSLQVLDLSSNQVGSRGATFLAKALRKNSSLNALFLDSNSIGDEGAQAFAHVLHKCKKLSHLSLMRNHVGQSGIDALCTSLPRASCIVKVSVEHDDEFGQEILDEEVPINDNVEERRLRKNLKDGRRLHKVESTGSRRSHRHRHHPASAKASEDDFSTAGSASHRYRHSQADPARPNRKQQIAEPECIDERRLAHSDENASLSESRERRPQQSHRRPSSSLESLGFADDLFLSSSDHVQNNPRSHTAHSGHPVGISESRSHRSKEATETQEHSWSTLDLSLTAANVDLT